MKHDHLDGSCENEELERLWTAKDVAEFLRVSRSWVYHRASAGELPCLQIGPLIRFEPSRIKAYAGGERSAPARVVAIRGR